jgi:hypothetical protein
MIDLTQFNLSIKFTLEQAVRDSRNKILNETVDRINPIRYESLTTQQQTELKIYRQALLDISKQSGWPGDITWPTKPTWL